MYRMLLVEDEGLIREGLRKMIEQLGIGFQIVAEAANGKEALQIMMEHELDVVLTDIRMKEMDGLLFIEKLREAGKEIPVIIITGHHEIEYTRKAIKNRVADYVLKPVNRTELSRTLLQIKSQLDQARGQTTAQAGEASDESLLIRKAKELIHDRLGHEITLQSIADEVHLSYHYLSQLFKNETGRSFVEYVTECRMEKAKKLLRESNMKVYQIAELSGYPNPKHFMTVFKQQTGITPKEYREQRS